MCAHRHVAEALGLAADYMKNLRHSVFVDIYCDLLLFAFQGSFTAPEVALSCGLLKEALERLSTDAGEDLLHVCENKIATLQEESAMSAGSTQALTRWLFSTVLSQPVLFRAALFSAERSRVVHPERRLVETAMPPFALKLFETTEVHERRHEMHRAQKEKEAQDARDARLRKEEEARVLKEESQLLLHDVHSNISSREQSILDRLSRIDAALRAQQIG